MRCFYDVAKSYPDIRADDANIDALAFCDPRGCSGACVKRRPKT
jgi:hypothetical protein